MKPIIEINNLTKVYNIGHEQSAAGTTTFRDVLTSVFTKPMELITGHRLEKEKFLALDDISFDIQKGDVVGLIGKNGSGKSTLLKILSKIVEPTEGEIIMRGKSASLLEVGTGFHPELTGRENIFFNGAILGMSQREIRSKFDEIVTFSGVEKFLDTPVKFYSSGMYVRLAFAVAAHLEPDILMVDEVLAVGDAEFQKKSLGKMRDVTSNHDRTVIFVSHNMEAIQSVCNKCVWLSAGHVVKFGNTEDVIKSYMEEADPHSSIPLKDRKDRQGNKKVMFMSVEVINDVKNSRELRFKISVSNKTDERFRDIKLSLGLLDNTKHMISNLTNNAIGQKLAISKKGKNEFELIVSNVNLVPGMYSFDLFLASDQHNSEIFDWVTEAGTFMIEDYDYHKVGYVPQLKGTVLYMDFEYAKER